jgi:hypothetical protein
MNGLKQKMANRRIWSGNGKCFFNIRLNKKRETQEAPKVNNFRDIYGVPKFERSFSSNKNNGGALCLLWKGENKFS